jgi:glycosyltransferase involved in cell wall biosynthesis
MRILIVTYANRYSESMGVGRYYNQVADILEKEGHELVFLNHSNPLKVDKITLNNTLIPIFSGARSKRFGKIYESLKPDAVHIQSEVGLGISARNYCVENKIPYSSAYHTNWDIGMKYWAYMPSSPIWAYLRWFFKPSGLIHVCSQTVKDLLRSKGIKNKIEIFSLGVDKEKFYFDPDPSLLSEYPRPYFMSLSRVAKEKNLEAFLNIELPGTKFVIGDGPYKKYLEKKYSGKAVFLPYKNVRAILSLGDVCVFPSLYDTFGLTNIEALACGLPIAAFPVMGPLDIIEQGVSGYTSKNLKEAALNCLALKKEDCIKRSAHFSWKQTAHEFLKHQILLT